MTNICKISLKIHFKSLQKLVKLDALMCGFHTAFFFIFNDDNKNNSIPI